MHRALSLSVLLTFSSIKFFSEFIRITLFCLIDLHNLFRRQNLTEFIIILLTNIQDLTALCKLILNLFFYFRIRRYWFRSLFSFCIVSSVSFVAVHHPALTQCFQVTLVNRSKFSSRSVIQHQCFYHLVSLSLHHLLGSRALFLILIILILSRNCLATNQKSGHHYINKLSLHNLLVFY